VSIRRACGVLELDRSTYHYKSRRPDQAGLEARIKEICATRVRYGYRRVHVLLCREGWDVNIKKAYRIYRELGLQLRNKTPKRRAKAKLRDDRKPAMAPNETWAMDFVHDQLATGKKIRVLTVVDTFSRFSPVIDPRFSYRAEDVVGALGARLRKHRLSEDDPRRSGLGVHLPRHGSVGVCPRRYARLLAPRQADRQRVHRSIQRAVAGGMPERPLVPDA
jgi:transposase InsO family protein